MFLTTLSATGFPELISIAWYTSAKAPLFSVFTTCRLLMDELFMVPAPLAEGDDVRVVAEWLAARC